MTPDPKATPATDHKAERTRSIVGLYVNRLCSCGGSGPRDINACAACWLYHHIREKDEKIATLEAQVKRCHGIMQEMVSNMEVDESFDCEKELSGEFCPGACTTECDERAAALEARIKELESRLTVDSKS